MSPMKAVDPPTGPLEVSRHRAKRTDLVGRIADTLLACGVAQIPLRDLAVKLGTSDRMLLYYFDDKADLIRASLVEVSTRLAARLEEAIPLRRLSPAKLIERIMPFFTSPEFGPFMNVWADISARGGRGEEPFRSIARRSVEAWLGWLENRLHMDDVARRRSTAMAILIVVEGSRMLEASVPGAPHAALEVLSRSFLATGQPRSRKVGDRRHRAGPRHGVT